jgi:hypothetical protein
LCAFAGAIEAFEGDKVSSSGRHHYLAAYRSEGLLIEFTSELDRGRPDGVVLVRENIPDKLNVSRAVSSLQVSLQARTS